MRSKNKAPVHACVASIKITFYNEPVGTDGLSASVDLTGPVDQREEYLLLAQTELSNALKYQRGLVETAKMWEMPINLVELTLRAMACGPVRKGTRQ